MNAVATEVTEQLSVDCALAAVKAQVIALRAVEADHLSNAAALARGRERLSSAEAELEKINSDNAAAITRHAKRLEEQTRSGSVAPVPQLAPSDEHLAKEIRATRTLAAARQMIVNLQSTVDAGTAQCTAALARVESALAQLHIAEVHSRIWEGLELLDEFETVFAAIYSRTESRGDSHFGDAIWDADRDHQKLRAVWNVLESRRLGPASPATTGVLTPQPPLLAARAALAARDAQLINPTEEPTS